MSVRITIAVAVVSLLVWTVSAAGCAGAKSSAADGAVETTAEKASPKTQMAKLFEMRVPVPTRSVPRNWASPTVEGVKDEKTGIEWFVERRGGGVPSIPDELRRQLATQFAAAAGDEAGRAPEAITFDGRDAYRVDIESDEIVGAVVVVFAGGYLYGLAIRGPLEKRTAVDDAVVLAVEKGRLESEQEQPQPPPVTLESLGLDIPPVAGWSSSPVDSGVLLFSNPAEKLAVVVGRGPLGPEDRDRQAFEDAAEKECVDAATAASVTLGEHTGWKVSCVAPGKNPGERNVSLLMVFPLEDDAVRMLVTGPFEKKSAVEAFGTRLLNESSIE